MTIRLKDIAEELNLSVTTVSRALAGYPDVAESTRELVHHTAQRMGYVPHAAAQRLQKRCTNTIGFIVPTFGPRFSDPFFSELIAGIGNQAGREGYDLLLSTVAPGPGEIEMYRRLAYSRRVDGMLVVRTRHQDPRIEFLVQNAFPFVAFGRNDRDLDFPWVDVDGVVGMRLAVEHLVDLGHTRIAYLGGPPEVLFSTLRWQGFESTMTRYEIPVEREWLLQGDLTQHSGHELAGQLLDAPNRPTAIVAVNDLMALGAMAAAQHRGLEIGRDLSVIGFDDIPSAESAHPPLTTVHQPVYHIAVTITYMLIQMLRDELLIERQKLLTPNLVVRRSTGPAL